MAITEPDRRGSEADAGPRISGLSPRLCGCIVVVAIMAVPGIPTAYLVPPAILAGAFAVNLLERRRMRRMRADQPTSGGIS